MIALIGARYLDRQQFGIFSLELAWYLVLLGLCRALATDPFVVRFSSAEPGSTTLAAEGASGAALAMGLVAGVATASAGIAIGRDWLWPLLVIGAGFPVLLAQDSLRYVLFVTSRPRAAVRSDAAWCVVQIVAVAPVILAHAQTPSTLVAAWVAGSAAGVVVGVLQTGIRPAPSHARRWVQEHRDLSGPFVGEFVATTGALQIALFVVAGVAGVKAVGAIRAANVLFGPLTVLFLGLNLVALPEAVRLRAKSIPDLKRFILALGVGLPLIALLWTALLVLLPSRVGAAILGENWEAARGVVLPVGATIAATACALAALMGLRAVEAARASFAARLTAIPLILAGASVGAALAAALGAATGLAAAYSVDAGVAWITYRWVVRRLPPRNIILST